MAGINVIDVHGKAQGTIALEMPREEKEVSARAFATAVRVLLQNWRQGTVGCKRRSDVAFSGKKPWKQKGTGRARAGTKASPLWRKGGVVFGPNARTRTLKVPARLRRNVFGKLFFDAHNEERISCLDAVFEKPTTKTAAASLRSLGAYGKQVVIFAQFDDEAIMASFRNIPGVMLLAFDEPNYIAP